MTVDPLAPVERLLDKAVLTIECTAGWEESRGDVREAVRLLLDVARDGDPMHGSVERLLAFAREQEEK